MEPTDVDPAGWLGIPDPEHTSPFVVPGIADVAAPWQAVRVIDDTENAIDGWNAAASHGEDLR
jgi:hypothetical protein